MSDTTKATRKRATKVRFVGGDPPKAEQVRLDTEGSLDTNARVDAEAFNLGPELIDPDPNNVRTGPPDLVADARLRASILENGIIEPPTVREHPTEPGRYMIVMGHRRVAAARAAGLDAIPCLVLSNDHDPARITAIQAAENMVRLPMHPVDQWRAVQRMIAHGMTERSAYASVGIGTRDGALLSRLARMHQCFVDCVRALPAGAVGEFRRVLHVLSSADMAEQDRAWKRVEKVAPKSPDQALRQGAAALTKPEITADVAIFQIVLEGGPIAWTEDLFKPDNDASRFTTTDVKGFLREQRTALKALAAAEAAAGHPCIFVEFDDKKQDPVLPPGWKQSYMDAAKPLPKGSTSTVATYVRTSGYSIGQVVRMRLDPKVAKQTKGAGATTTAADEPEKPARGPVTQNGMAMIAEAQERAIHAALEDTQDVPTLLAALLLAMGGTNVIVQGSPVDYEPVYNGYTDNRLTDLSARIAECGRNASGVDFTETLRACTREAIKRIAICPAPKKSQSSGDRALWLGHFLDALRFLPRMDSPEFLAEVNAETLRGLCDLTGKTKGKTADMRAALAGALSVWAPPGAEFPGPTRDRLDALLRRPAEEPDKAHPDNGADEDREAPETDSVFGEPEPTGVGGDDYVGVPGA